MGVFPASATPEAATEALTGEQAAATRMRGMSLEQKVGQLFVTYAYGPAADSAHPKNLAEFGVATPAEVVRKYHLGGVIYFNWTDSFANPKQVAALSNGLQRAAMSSGARLPLLISTDQEQGVVTRFSSPATLFPGSMALGAARDAGLARQAAEITGRELRAVGINQNFAPDADVNVNPANPVIGVRSFSSDPKLVAQQVTAQVKGYQQGRLGQSVSATVKHFPGHGDTNQDSHYTLPVINHTPEQWQQLDAPPFQAAIKAGVDSIMSAHIVTPKLDDSGEPATLSPKMLTGLLRGQLGYRGVIITDSLQMEAVRIKHPDAEIPVLALKAGADMLLMPKNLDVAIKAVLDAVRSGEISERRIDESLLRVLLLKIKRGALTHPLVDEAAVDKIVGIPRHLATAQQVTDRTITAVRNDAGLLPLRAKPGKVLVAGSSSATALGQKLTARGVSPTVQVTGDKPTEAMIAKAVAAAEGQDLIVVLTNRATTDAQQRELVKRLVATGKPVVGVAVRDPYDVAIEDAKTWLTTYSATAVSMESLTKVLFGEAKPSGKLPVSVPALGDPAQTRYPFGFGLTW
ncbi:MULTISPECIES: glycoside hydrolase family 3 protein [unclassified Crossiella]|uniref:glycoside hydrolase family 3 protein n=1 Tax=unclassified Crossiella TaxID=2620835 RepID=UPI002000195E|nr:MULTISPECIES: glycoside hydrolase family 3 protein [unclassified Crossiella]MCK2237665.1 glycoside hydrolase family 3 protein [Crossiella sp. S99.2]MCK2254951.1 glycoside hydrolase family 3 protein [Crossiella sp. S99.1]